MSHSSSSSSIADRIAYLRAEAKRLKKEVRKLEERKADEAKQEFLNTHGFWVDEHSLEIGESDPPVSMYNVYFKDGREFYRTEDEIRKMYKREGLPVPRAFQSARERAEEDEFEVDEGNESE